MFVVCHQIQKRHRPVLPVGQSTDTVPLGSLDGDQGDKARLGIDLMQSRFSSEANTESSDLREWLLRDADVSSNGNFDGEVDHRRSFQIASMDSTGRLIVWTVVELAQV
jgi:hypothetical protein